MDKISISKKAIFTEFLRTSDFVVCPICNNDLQVYNSSLICPNNHTFDINKKGYVRLLKKQRDCSDKIYTNILFNSRRIVINAGFYDKMHIVIAEFIEKYLLNNNKKVILEIGSGESTHSYHIKKLLNVDNNFIVSDLSKEAMELSTDYLFYGINPVLCDAYNLPFKNESADIILDILSPYFHNEIKRVLKNDGYIIKVFPGKNYLKEIRDMINVGEYTKNEEVFNNFSKYFTILEIKNVCTTFELQEQMAFQFIKMTPLTKNFQLQNYPKKITIDLNIAIAKCC